MQFHEPHTQLSSVLRVTLACVTACAILVATIACESRPRSAPDDTPPQTWWEERGPVVPHDTFPTDCAECHLGDGWESITEDFTFDHELETGVRLDGAHASAECLLCHNDIAPIDVVASRGCRGCHEDPHRRMLGVQCQDCHTEDFWGVKGDIGLHNRTRFPLVGAHAATACYRCHDGAEVGNFSFAPIECVACHQADLKSATNPDHIAQGWVNNCDECHIPTQWSGGSGFNHESFPLLGVHAVTDCEQCHANQQFGGEPTNCAGCHLDDFLGTSNPNHTAAGFPQDCDLCHNNASFEGTNFDHSQFPLVSAHAAVDCADCHQGNVFIGTQSDCASCHIDVYNATSSPNHAASGYSTSCEQCHSPTTWENANFDHQFFPLTGAHMGVDCESCHVNGDFQGTSSQCASCHIQAYNQTTDPNHQAAGFPQQCDQCHSPTSWESANFDHSSFPLIGQHQAADCDSCHGNGVFNGTPNDCASCHITDYAQTNSPNHQAAGFPTDCQVCHTPISWQGGNFDHDQFPLTGSHLAADCADCHLGGVYQGTASDCASCHIAEYNSTTSPDHAAAGFPTDCQVCHVPINWNIANFDHSQFPLNGAHAATDCASCHVGGVFQGTPSSCVSCHLTEYNSTTDPNHAAAGFPTSCQDCHQTFTWDSAAFDHSQFPLTGAHSNTDCASCHVGGVFAGTSSDCASCHIAEYNATNAPNHSDAGFPTSCQTCHTPTQWTGANFDHSSWPLTGQHKNADCNECHQNGVYDGTPTNCASCHLSDYNQTSNPNHSAAGFPTSCQTCHNTNGWNGANFDHNFPLKGPHNLDCIKCHTNPNNYSQFTCIECHEHSQSKMKKEHKDVGGYSYNSNACLSCHPNGKD